MLAAHAIVNFIKLLPCKTGLLYCEKHG